MDIRGSGASDKPRNIDYVVVSVGNMVTGFYDANAAVPLIFHHNIMQFLWQEITNIKMLREITLIVSGLIVIIH